MTSREALVAAPMLLLLLAVASYAQPMPATAVQLRFNVSSSELKIVVYPDGAIQPYYNLSMTVQANESLGAAGSITLSYTGSYDGRTDESQAALEGSLRLHEPAEPLKLLASLASEYTLSQGTGSGSFYATFFLENATASYNVSVEVEAGISGSTASLSLVAKVPQDLLNQSISGAGASGEIPSVDEVNAKLASLGYTFVRVEKLSVALLPGGLVELAASLTVNVDEMLQTAKSYGLSDEQAAKVEALLRGNFTVMGAYNASLNVTASEDRVTLSGGYAGSVEGDVEEFERASAEAYPALISMLSYLLLPLANQYPDYGFLALQIQSLATQAERPQLIKAAPSSAETAVEVKLEGSTVHVNVRSRGHRFKVMHSVGDPARDAENALDIYAESLQQGYQMLSALAALMPGIVDIVPSSVKLEPADPSVKLSMSAASIFELQLVAVSLEKPTPTSTATETAAQTSTETTPVPQQQTGTQTPTSTVQPSPTATSSPTAPSTTMPQTKTPTQTPTASTPTAPTTASTTTSPGRYGSTVSIGVAAVIAAILIVVAARLVRR